jgi:serine O-acetyltransferase
MLANTMFERLRRDVERYFALDSDSGKPELQEKLRILLRSYGLQGIAVYRFGAWATSKDRPRLARLPLRALYRALDTDTFVTWGVHIDVRAQIEGGLYIGHPSGVLIGPVVMGRDCNIAHAVTIGRRADGQAGGGVPTVGDRVWIGAGSVLFGGISIGDGVTIAPLTMVSRNVGPRSLVAGSPMRVLRRDYDNTRAIFGQAAGGPAAGGGRSAEGEPRAPDPSPARA